MGFPVRRDHDSRSAATAGSVVVREIRSPERVARIALISSNSTPDAKVFALASISTVALSFMSVEQSTANAKDWCGREDSNLHGIAPASPSSWCVYQFRHCRKSVVGRW